MWRLLYRLPLLALHLLLATPVVVLCQLQPLSAMSVGGSALGEAALRSWGRIACRIFGLRVRVTGQLHPGAKLLAANHVSWIDIPLLQSVAGPSFVSKAEIQRWPVIGWLARIGQTVFHQRGSHDSASSVVEVVAERLREGGTVAVFPEGGILSGEGVKRFHARMFGAAVDAGVPVQPVMLRYSRQGRPYEDITFAPGEPFLANFFRLLRQAPCLAEVALQQAVATEGRQRRQVAADAEAAVSSAYAAGVPRD